MYSIGEFSRICQVSIKTLHHYNRIGLLEPLLVNPNNGYRYYGTAQIDTLLLIKRLKRYGLPLSDIRHFLEDDDKRTRLATLRQQKEKLNTQKQQTTWILNELTTHLADYERTGDIMNIQKNYTITLTTTPEQAVLSHRQMMGVNEFGTYYSGLYERMAASHLTPNGLRGAIYYDDTFQPECSDIALIVGIHETDKADTILPSQQCATTIHKGSYATLPDAYGALVAWIEAHGYMWNGTPYELYTKTQFDGLAPEDWETEIYFPIKQKEA